MRIRPFTPLTILLAANLSAGSELGPWWSEAEAETAGRGEVSQILKPFAFERTAYPSNSALGATGWHGFFLGNGNIGMIIDPLGAQALPYLGQAGNPKENALDPTIGSRIHPRMTAPVMEHYRNTQPSIGHIDAWVSGNAEHGNRYQRGPLSVRAVVFPLLDGAFSADPKRIGDYRQRIDLAENRCRTEFTYDGKVRMIIEAMVSWSETGLCAYQVTVTNLSQKVVRVGMAAEPVATFGNHPLPFWPREGQPGQLSMTDKNSHLHPAALSAGARWQGTRMEPADHGYVAEMDLAPGAMAKGEFFLAFTTGRRSKDPVATANEVITSALTKGWSGLAASHDQAVKEFWNRSAVLVPWKDLAKAYHRHLLFVANNMRFAEEFPTVSTLTAPSYFGLGWGMDNYPAYELMLSTGRADHMVGIARHLRATLPTDPKDLGAQLHYDFGPDPWGPSYMVCNSSGNYSWLLYLYARMQDDSAFLRDTAYPVMRSVANFWSGYANEAGGSYGFWTRQSYAGKNWEVHTYDEMVHTLRPGYQWAEQDHVTDAVAPAMLMLEKAIATARELGVDAELIPRWQRCRDRLNVAQNDKYIVLFPKDPFPARPVVACGIFNAIWPTPTLVGSEKLENSYRAIREVVLDPNYKLFYFASFNYNHQLYAAVARMRMPSELEWLLTQSPMRLGQAYAKDGMMLAEGAGGSGAGHFFLPHAMIPMSVVEMLLQSYDGTIRTFPCIPPGWDVHPVRFDRLSAYGAFSVSASRRSGKTEWIRLNSKTGRPCRLEQPLEWTAATVVDQGNGTQMKATKTSETARIGGVSRPVTILSFPTLPGHTYLVRANP